MDNNNNNNEKTIDMIKFEVPYFQAPNAIFDLQLDITSNSKLVYLYLCRCGNNGADAFPSYNRIAEICGIGRRTAISCVQELINANLLYKQSRKNEKGEATSNLYIVNTPENATCARLSKEQIKAKRKTRKRGGATDALPKKEKIGSATDALGSATDAPRGATDAPYKELLINKPVINNYNSISSSSKGESVEPTNSLVELFNSSICELKKTTTVKFMSYAEKYDKKFIEAVISYCEAQGAKSFSYFDKAIKSYLEAGVTTAEGVSDYNNNYHAEQNKKKNNALKAKDDAKKENNYDNYINELMMNDLASDNQEKVEVVGQDMNYLKESIKCNTRDSWWIKSVDLRLKNNETIVAYCPNMFTKDIISEKHRGSLLNAMKKNNLNYKLNIVVQNI